PGLGGASPPAGRKDRGKNTAHRGVWWPPRPARGPGKDGSVPDLNRPATATTDNAPTPGARKGNPHPCASSSPEGQAGSVAVSLPVWSCAAITSPPWTSLFAPSTHPGLGWSPI